MTELNEGAYVPVEPVFVDLDLADDDELMRTCNSGWRSWRGGSWWMVAGGVLYGARAVRKAVLVEGAV